MHEHCSDDILSSYPPHCFICIVLSGSSAYSSLFFLLPIACYLLYCYCFSYYCHFSSPHLVKPPPRRQGTISQCALEHLSCICPMDVQAAWRCAGPLLPANWRVPVSSAWRWCSGTFVACVWLVSGYIPVSILQLSSSREQRCLSVYVFLVDITRGKLFALQILLFAYSFQRILPSPELFENVYLFYPIYAEIRYLFFSAFIPSLIISL